MIVPTIGRVVLVQRRYANTGKQAEPALVAYVHNDRCINVGGFDSNGLPFSGTSLRLRQPEDAIPDDGVYAEWMPFQVAMSTANDLSEARRMASAGAPLIDVGKVAT